MNKTNKVRKGEVRIYGGKTYVALIISISLIAIIAV